MLACIVFLSVTACTSSQLGNGAASSASVDAVKDLSIFDSIVTLEAVFPDPAVRARYRLLSHPQMSEESRMYTFELIRQPGMEPEGDTHYINVTLTPIIAPARAFPATKRRHKEDAMGRREESINFDMPTPNGIYNLGISSDIRLPDTVDIPELDLESMAKRLQLHYLRKLNKLNKALPKSLAETSPEPSINTVAAKDFTLFDSIVTLETMFPDPAMRALYKKNPVQTQAGTQGYSFALTRQPGMEDRHFHDISVVLAPAGTFGQGTQVSAGQGGDTIDFVTRTPDGMYDLRVSETMRLPSMVGWPEEFDPISTAERLLQHYLQEVGKRLSFFDSITTLNAVFPDPGAQAFFETSQPETTENGGRAYSFSLIRQPGMDGSDYCIITVVWAPVGTFLQGLGGMGGAGGGGVDFVTRTPDGVYDLRVSLGMSLPVTAVGPQIDLKGTAERLLLRYSRLLPKQQTKSLRGE